MSKSNQRSLFLLFFEKQRMNNSVDNAGKFCTHLIFAVDIASGLVSVPKCKNVYGYMVKRIYGRFSTDISIACTEGRKVLFL